MADIQTLPKHSRIDQQRPPFAAEPVDAGILARMQLPRYQAPRPARGRSRKKAQADLPAADEIPAAQRRPEPRQPVVAADRIARPAPTQPPARQPAGQPPQERTSRPQPASPYSQPASPQAKPDLTRQPYNATFKPQTPQSPYEKRPPFNTAVPLRREPAQNTSQPAQNTGRPPESPAAGSLPSGGAGYGANRSAGGSQPAANRPAGETARGAGEPVSGSRQPADAGGNRPANAPFNGSPANRSAGSSGAVAGGSSPLKPSGQPGQNAARPSQGAGQPKQATPRPEVAPRPYSGQPQPGPRPNNVQPVANPPGQSRLFRLPPLDFNFNDPPAPAAADSEPEDRPQEEKNAPRPEPRPTARPRFNRQEALDDEAEDHSAPVERPVKKAGPQPRREPLADVDTDDEQPLSAAQGAIPRAETLPASGALPDPDPEQESEDELYLETPSLRELLLNGGSLPPQATILGVGSDQLPVLLDLNDPAPGSLLVVGDERHQALDLLRVAVTSLALRSTARGVQFIVFSHQPESWNEWIEEMNLRRYCLGVVGAESSQAREWIYRLADWGVQRSSDNRGGPPVLVLFDTLSFLTRLLPDARQRLEGLIRGGPDVRIWSIAAVSTALAGSLGKQLDVFDTRIWGYSEDSSVYTRLAGVHAAEAREFGAPGRFAVRVGPPGEQFWLKFRLPSLDGLMP